METDTPDKGYNHSGEWFKGKKDTTGKEITCSHPNARFTLDLHILPNLDPALDDPEGVVIKTCSGDFPQAFLIVASGVTSPGRAG